ncbi:hypothetical protein V6N13_072148 [Hibiscus sabdariffa]
MENPIAITAFNCGLDSFGSSAGRPHDEVIILESPTALEHLESPFSDHTQPTVKNGRNDEANIEMERANHVQIHIVFDLLMRETSEVGYVTVVIYDVDAPEKAARDTRSSPDSTNEVCAQIPSLWVILNGVSGGGVQSRNNSELDVEVKEEDIRIRCDDT